MRDRQTALSALRAFVTQPTLAMPFGLAIALALLGPFNTHGALDLGERLAFWIMGMLAGTFVYIGTEKLVEDSLGDRLGPRRRQLIEVLLASLPITAIVFCLNILFDLGIPARQLPGLYWAVVVVTGLASIMGSFLQRLQAAETGEPLPAPAAPSDTAARSGKAADTPALTDHLPGPIPMALKGQPLIALESEDHYLRLHTPSGSDLVLMRLRDAAEALAHTDGLQVHRSYWVAKSAVTGQERIKGRLHLRLTTGALIPVSRSYMDAVRRAGLGNG